MSKLKVVIWGHMFGVRRVCARFAGTPGGQYFPLMPAVGGCSFLSYPARYAGIRRATRRHFSAEDKLRIVLEGLRGEDSIAELCRRKGMVQNL
jgi:hypothetical protein